jgi:hypothetical protein
MAKPANGWVRLTAFAALFMTSLGMLPWFMRSTRPAAT